MAALESYTSAYHEIFDCSHAAARGDASLHKLLLLCEWLFSSKMIEISGLVQCMKSAYPHNGDNPKAFISYLNKIFYCDDQYAIGFSRIIGERSYSDLLNQVGHEVVSIPFGLAPSLSMFVDTCRRCSMCKLIRSFCLRCGLFHDPLDSLGLRATAVAVHTDNDTEAQQVESPSKSRKLFHCDSGISHCVLNRDIAAGQSVSPNHLDTAGSQHPHANGGQPRIITLKQLREIRDRKKLKNLEESCPSSQQQCRGGHARAEDYAAAALRGIQRLVLFCQPKAKQFRSHRNTGDMLFLMRNLATNCTDLHRKLARKMYLKLCRHWLKEFDGSSDSDSDFMDVLISTFPIKQMLTGGSKTWHMWLENKRSESESLRVVADHHPPNSSSNADVECIDQMEDGNEVGDAYDDDYSRIKLALMCTDFKTMTSLLTGVNVKVEMDGDCGGDEMHINECAHSNSPNNSTAKRRSGTMGCCHSMKTRGTAFNKASISKLEQVSAEFDDLDYGDVPPMCAQILDKYKSTLANCKAAIKHFLKSEEAVEFKRIRLSRQSNIEYDHDVDCKGTTEALCWGYLTESAGFDINIHRAVEDDDSSDYVLTSTLSSAMLNLSFARDYKPFDRFYSRSNDAFVSQCYLVTHVVYAFSDWGAHLLRRQLFAEEFIFIVRHMAVAVEKLEDPEIVGEFLHCLRILQYDPRTDPAALTDLVEKAMDFLLHTERELGRRGTWVSDSSDFYTRYHAAYCAVVGLAECRFTYAENDGLPIPHILQYVQYPIVEYDKNNDEQTVFLGDMQ